MHRLLHSASKRSYTYSHIPLSTLLYHSRCARYNIPSTSYFKNGFSSLSLDKDSMGHLALGSVMCRAGDTVCHVAVTTEPKYDSTDGNFLPLTVEYRSRAYAYGLLPDNRMKRDQHGTEDQVLSSRIIDRSIRSLFQKGYVDEIQVTATVHCVDNMHDPISTSVNATSMALMKAGVPWQGPVGCVRVGIVNGELKANMTIEETKNSELDLLYTGNKERCIMIEAVGNEIPEEKMDEALYLAQRTVLDIINEQERLLAPYLAERNQDPANIPKSIIHLVPEDFASFVHDKAYDIAIQVFRSSRHLPRKQRSKLEGKLNYDIGRIVKDDPIWGLQPLPVISIAVHDVMVTAFRQSVIEHDINVTDTDTNAISNKNLRVDGRGINEIRPISMEISNLPDAVHGSSIFRRGETHVLTTATLGSLEEANKKPMEETSSIVASKGSYDERKDDTVVPSPSSTKTLNEEDFQSKDNFILHYDFPAYSTGSIGMSVNMNRRMVGHGKLAEKALRHLMPSMKDFPYMIRVYCECTSSNGSSSMASVCGASLAMMDAGIPIKSPAAGISIGLITHDQRTCDSYTLLTDLIGQEDHYGDMDFKIAGTRKGITAMQLDGKLIEGISVSVLNEALLRAKSGRSEILDKMTSTIASTRSETKLTAPQAELVPFHSDRKLLLIGRGGDVINFIRSQYDVEIEIFEKHQPEAINPSLSSEQPDNCYAYIYGRNRANAIEAKMFVQDLVSLLRVGDVFTSEIAEVKDFGMIVKLTRAQAAVLHMSELSWDPNVVKSQMTSLFTVGQRIDVKVIYVDKTSGSVKVSRKVLLDKEACAGKPDDHILRPRLHIKAITTDDPSTRIHESSSLKPIQLLPQFPVEPPIPFNRDYFQSNVASDEEVRKALMKLNVSPESMMNKMESQPTGAKSNVKNNRSNPRDRDHHRGRDHHRDRDHRLNNQPRDQHQQDKASYRNPRDSFKTNDANSKRANYSRDVDKWNVDVLGGVSTKEATVSKVDKLVDPTFRPGSIAVEIPVVKKDES